MGETPIWVFALMGTCVLIEMVCSGWAGKKIYQANETFVNIACGILERLLDLVVFIALFGIFKYIHQSGFVLFHLPRPLPGYLYLPLLLAAIFAGTGTTGAVTVSTFCGGCTLFTTRARIII